MRASCFNLISLFIHLEAMLSTICPSCRSFHLHISLNTADSDLVYPSFHFIFCLIHRYSYYLMLMSNYCQHLSAINTQFLIHGTWYFLLSHITVLLPFLPTFSFLCQVVYQFIELYHSDCESRFSIH